MNAAFERALGHYLRPDVSETLWELARRRPLSFYHWTDRDYRLGDAKRRRLALHCLPSLEQMHKTIGNVVARVADCGEPFYPFFTMGGRANAPGRPEAIVGWDLTLEADLDLIGSFQALVPLVGLLDHLGVPRLAKFSGHRSLHVVVPAEALAPALGHSTEQREWFAALTEIGRFLCRVIPALTATWVAVARDTPLTAPYSFHRYHGLLNIPVTLDEALSFDPVVADPNRFAGVTWRPVHWDACGEAGRELLDVARRSEHDRQLPLRLAETAFRGSGWRGYLDALAEAEPSPSEIEAAIYAGPLSVAHEPENDRVRRAIAALDDPDFKTAAVQRLFGDPGFNADFRLGRREASRALAVWATEGLDAALRHLLEAGLTTGEPRGRITRVVRLVGLLPEPAVAHLPGDSDDLARTLCRALVRAEASGGWRTEDRPDLAVSALRDAFGSSRVRQWVEQPQSAEGRLVVEGVFGGDERKLAFAAREADR